LHLRCRREARAEASQEPLLSSFYHASILSHDSFARSLAFVLANRLADATLLATELFEIFHSVLREHEVLKQAALLDIVAFYERVSGCLAVCTATANESAEPTVFLRNHCVLMPLEGVHT
jgi:serine O-acetyltransferase